MEASRADVERRDRVVGEREAAFERLASKRRSVADALDAETDEKARWLEEAMGDLKEADAHVAQAKGDAEREEALRGITDRAEERITGFLSRVVGDVGYIAYRTLSVMVEMGVGGERFASAARVCMGVINAMSEDAIGRPFSQTPVATRPSARSTTRRRRAAPATTGRVSDGRAGRLEGADGALGARPVVRESTVGKRPVSGP